MVTGSITNFVVNITYNFCCKEIYKVRIKLNIHRIKKKGTKSDGALGFGIYSDQEWVVNGLFTIMRETLHGLTNPRISYI